MMKISALISALLISAFAWSACPLLAFNNLKFAPTAPPRTLVFPLDKSYGVVDVSPRKKDKTRSLRSFRVEARGKINIPKDMLVRFEANRFFFVNPQIVKGFAPDSFDVVNLRLISMDDNEDDLVDRALAAMTHLKGIRWLVLDKSETSDVGYKSVAKLTDLEQLDGFLTPTQGAFLKDCTSLKKLQIMSFDSVTIREEYLKYLKDYPSLRALSLSRTGMSNLGLKSIADCVTLQELVVSRNLRITDAGLWQLRTLRKLRSLNLQDTAVTTKGILSLKGVPLRDLMVSSTSVSQSDIPALRAVFPGLNVMIKNEKPTVDDDTNTIFGQLSRQRKL